MTATQLQFSTTIWRKLNGFRRRFKQRTEEEMKTVASTEYFTILDTKTKTCTVADKKPKTRTLKIVGDATYRTQAEAENGMKIIKACIRQ
jgi:hypothetical protein